MSVNRRKPRLAQRCQLRMRRDTLGSWLRCQSSKADGSLAAARESACDMDADLGGPLFGRYQAVGSEPRPPASELAPRFERRWRRRPCRSRLIERLPHLGTFLSRVG